MSDSYSRIAGFYAFAVDPMNAALWSTSLKFHPVDSGDRVLDVGCGTGRMLEAYADAGAICSGVDLSKSMLGKATELLGDRADLRIGDATSLPYEDGSFDLAMCSLMLHELEPDVRAAVLAEMIRVIATNGRILVIDYRVGSLTMRGRVTRTVSTVAERLAGSSHYANWREYMRTGGLPSLAATAGLDVDREKITSGGNMALWLLSRG